MILVDFINASTMIEAFGSGNRRRFVDFKYKFHHGDEEENQETMPRLPEGSMVTITNGKGVLLSGKVCPKAMDVGGCQTLDLRPE